MTLRPDQPQETRVDVPRRSFASRVALATRLGLVTQRGLASKSAYGDPPLSAHGSAPRLATARSANASRVEVLEQLGRGGMGRVYRILDPASGEERALKRMSEGAERDSFAVQAFEREYGVLTSLSHPRIIRVYDYGVDADGRYYTMELIRGQDLRELAPLSVSRACSYLRDVATSLSLLHARRLLHRDISAGNVRTTDEAHCKLLDFGALATFGRNRVIVGTPPSIAPEVLQGSALDQAVDLFALGALAYWLLTRRHAFPAVEIADLERCWRSSPLPPSCFAPDVPPELDELVLALLRQDPMARPRSAAGLIGRLTVIGGLRAEDDTETTLLAQSFLKRPPFTGRGPELEELSKRVARAISGRGGSVRVMATGGMGSTRLLDELGVAAQLAGAIVLRTDARALVAAHGTTRALIQQLLEKLPDSQSVSDGRTWQSLANLGPEVLAKLRAPAPGRPDPAPPSHPLLSAPEPASAPRSSGAAGNASIGTPGSLEAWIAAVSQACPVVVLVDDVDAADDASLGFLNALARLASQRPLLVVVSEHQSAEPRLALGLQRLRERATVLELRPLGAAAMLELARSLFCDPPNVERFADWLHERSGGSPLHAVELCRQLVTCDGIHFSAGVWTLPLGQPDAQLPDRLGDALSSHLASLTAAARSLAEVLSLTRDQPTMDLCRALLPGHPATVVREQIDELLRHDVLTADRDGYRFSSGAIRNALLEQMDPGRKRSHHAQLGEVLAARADNSASLVDAGYHLIEGGEDLRGADLIASVMRDVTAPRTLAPNLYRIGAPVEAALLAYERHRRSTYERLPLLAALAMVGYCEDRVWAERHGDAILDVLEQASGLALARHLRRWLGRWLSLLVGLGLAYLRYSCAPRRERPYPFKDIFIHLCASVASLAGTSTLCFDQQRAAHVAEVLEPFSVLPARLTPRGFYDYCRALSEVGSENTIEAYAMFDTAARRFGDMGHYRSLPPAVRRVMVAASHFPRAIYGMFQVRGTSALESADVLDDLGLALYSALASEIRFLYYTMRGEVNLAEPHRELVELHAARTGSRWQFETWETIALTIMHTVLLWDIVGATRVNHRLAELTERFPGTRIYHHIAEHALMVINGDPQYTVRVAPDYEALPERSFLGWTAMMGLLARGFNQIGDHARAHAICQRLDACRVEGERDYFPLFLLHEIEMSVAKAHLGHIAEGRERLRAELARVSDGQHPLVLGLLYEACARLAWLAGDREDFERCRSQVDRWFRPTEAPSLIAKCEQLSQLTRNVHPRHAGEPATERIGQRESDAQGDDDAFGASDTVQHTSR